MMSPKNLYILPWILPRNLITRTRPFLLMPGNRGGNGAKVGKGGKGGGKGGGGKGAVPSAQWRGALFSNFTDFVFAEGDLPSQRKPEFKAHCPDCSCRSLPAIHAAIKRQSSSNTSSGRGIAEGIVVVHDIANKSKADPTVAFACPGTPPQRWAAAPLA